MTFTHCLIVPTHPIVVVGGDPIITLMPVKKNPTLTLALPLGFYMGDLFEFRFGLTFVCLFVVGEHHPHNPSLFCLGGWVRWR